MPIQDRSRHSNGRPLRQLAQWPQLRNGKAQTRLGKKSGAKDLTDKGGAGKLSDEDVFKTIKLGRKDQRGEETMEPFGGELSDPEITALVTYVRRFTR